MTPHAILIVVVFSILSFVVGVFFGALIVIGYTLHKEGKENEEWAKQDLETRESLKDNV